MSALAALLKAFGCHVQGSDTAEEFFTGAVLRSAGIVPFDGFSADHVSLGTSLLIHSTAYDPAVNPEIQYARSCGMRVMTYPEALGALSQETFSVLVAGTHGKTGTTALTVHLLDQQGIALFGLFGAALADGAPYIATGTQVALFEACEYQRHFLVFTPDIILMTNVELDHPDYFQDVEDVERAFVELIERIPPQGHIVYCEDDQGARSVVHKVSQTRSDLIWVPYGTSDTLESPYRITEWQVEFGHTVFKLHGLPGEFRVPAPGLHQALNAAGAIALTLLLQELFGSESQQGLHDEVIEQLRSGLLSFPGCVRRSEVIGTAQGIIFMDDFAHHPTEIRRTLGGLRQRYPTARIVVDFIPHTFTRTERLHDDFVQAFTEASMVLIHPVYGSQREVAADGERGVEVSSRLAAAISGAQLVTNDGDAMNHAREVLKTGDLFITMGAGNNRSLGLALYDEFLCKEKERL